MTNTNGIILLVVIVVLAVLLIGGAGMMGFGGFGMMGPGMMGGYGRYGGMMGGYGAQGFGFNPLGGILSLVFWALIIAGVVMLVIWLLRNANRPGRPFSGETPVEILKARYAKGEITQEQFEAMKRDLA